MNGRARNPAAGGQRAPGAASRLRERAAAVTYVLAGGRNVREWAAPLGRGLVRGLGLALAVAATTSAATGWLYWVRADVGGWPRPWLPNALPLDELASHDSVPLIIYVVAYGTAAVMLGFLARALRLDRLVAGLGLAAAAAAWLLLADTVCMMIVRQEGAGPAFRAAAGLQAVYLGATLCGVAGAVLGVTKGGRTRVTTLLACLVAVGGLADLFAALFPPPGTSAGVSPTPGTLEYASHVLMVPAGVLLLFAARGMARGNRRAMHAALAFLALSVLLHLFRGPDYAGAVACGVIAVIVVARRQDLPYLGDPAAEPQAARRLIAMLLLAVVYGVTALWTYRSFWNLPFRPLPALMETLRALAGMAPRDARYIPGDFYPWFRSSVLLIAATGVAWAAGVWMRPWRHRLRHDVARRRKAAEIVRRWGSDTLSPFTLRHDKEWFVAGQTLLAYRVVRGVALVSGDPVGPPQEAGSALDAFRAHARARGWAMAILGASDRFLGLYRERGLREFYHGDESVVDTTAFSLEGRRMRSVRQAARRLDRSGYRAEVVTAGAAAPRLRAELLAVDRDWLRGGARKGFTMELDSLFRLGGDDAVFVVGRDPEGRVAGFLHLAVCHPSRALTLSSMPRRDGTPNGLVSWLIVTAIGWARSHGYTRVSLNFSPFAGLLSSDTGLSAAQRLGRGALLRLKGVLSLQLDNLLKFNRQFCPEAQPRHVVVDHLADLPRVIVAAMAAEGYLPRSRLIRGGGGPAGGEPDAGDEPAAEPAAAAAATSGRPKR